MNTESLMFFAVTLAGTTSEAVMCEAEMVPELADPAAAVSAVLSDAVLSEQPLIFSAHNIESYLAARQSAKEGAEARVCFVGCKVDRGMSYWGGLVLFLAQHN